MGNSMNGYRDKYYPLITQAKVEKTAKGKCDFIIAMLEMMAKNDIHNLCERQSYLQKKVNKMLVLLGIILAVVVLSNPKLTLLFSNLFLAVIGK